MVVEKQVRTAQHTGTRGVNLRTWEPVPPTHGACSNSYSAASPFPLTPPLHFTSFHFAFEKQRAGTGCERWHRQCSWSPKAWWRAVMDPWSKQLGPRLMQGETIARAVSGVRVTHLGPPLLPPEPPKGVPMMGSSVQEVQANQSYVASNCRAERTDPRLDVQSTPFRSAVRSI